jgi:hypothetical protein
LADDDSSFASTPLPDISSAASSSLSSSRRNRVPLKEQMQLQENRSVCLYFVIDCVKLLECMTVLSENS